ncbi:MAG: hypothetical protein QM757_00055 [Paludibaculum sp.]
MIPVLLLTALFASPQTQSPLPLSQRDPPEWARIQDGIHSKDWREREKAFHAIAGLGCSQADTVDAAFTLLGIEQTFLDNHIAELSPGEAEGWGDPYYSGLLGFTFSCFQKSPRPAWFRLLALGSYNPDSPYAKDLANYVDGNLEWLLSAAPAQKSPYRRANLYPLLVNALSHHADWSAKDRQAVLAAVDTGLVDPDNYTVTSTARAVAAARLPDARAMLLRSKSTLVKQRGNRTGVLQQIDKLVATMETEARQ